MHFFELNVDFIRFIAVEKWLCSILMLLLFAVGY